jgi:glutathione reductase (NADPH)
MTPEKYDVVILGGGNAGIGVTGPVRRAGMSVAMIEADLLGGTCPNRGCTPKKVLVAAGHALHEIERASIHHIAVGKPRLDWAALIDREKDMIKDIPANLARSMAKRNVEVIKGHAAFASPNTIRVGSRELEAKHIVIATGSKPRPLPIPGSELMITSDNMLSERELPASVIFVGGGVIALEFGHVYARAGAEVAILEALPQLLPAMDADAVACLQAESERIGIRVRTAVSVKRIEKANGRLRVVYTALWHYGHPDPRKYLRLSDVLLRHQAHARPRLENDPEKWVPVFPCDKRGTRLRGDHAQIKEIERDDEESSRSSRT